MGKGGLSFLNKKPWHTSSLRNLEIVWKAEQKENEKNRKLKERAKQIKEEKIIEDLKREQIKAGIISKAEGERLDWMYQVPLCRPSNEEFLLGAPLKNETANSEKNFSKDSKFVGANLCEKNFGGSEERKIKEDPLIAVERKEKSERDAILSNPRKMQKIYSDLKLLKVLKKEKRYFAKKRPNKKCSTNNYNNRREKHTNLSPSSYYENKSKRRPVKRSSDERNKRFEEMISNGKSRMDHLYNG